MTRKVCIYSVIGCLLAGGFHLLADNLAPLAAGKYPATPLKKKGEAKKDDKKKDERKSDVRVINQAVYRANGFPVASTFVTPIDLVAIGLLKAEEAAADQALLSRAETAKSEAGAAEPAGA